MSLVIEMKSHGEGIRGRDHMYSSESFWRLCGNTYRESQEEKEVDNERKIIQRRDGAYHSQTGSSTGKGRSLSKGMLTDVLWNVKDLLTVSGNAFNLEIL